MKCVYIVYYLDRATGIRYASATRDKTKLTATARLCFRRANLQVLYSMHARLLQSLEIAMTLSDKELLVLSDMTIPQFDDWHLHTIELSE